MSTLHLRAAREHNLQGIDLDLPLGRWIAVVGPSGSGKSSLVQDVIVREGQRRTLGALSARARFFLGKLGRARVGRLDGLPATIAVGQRALTTSARSTVGTLTGGMDLLRLLFARCAVLPTDVAPEELRLTRAHFSFNHPDGACPACQGLGVEDRVDPALLVADPARSIRDGALVPTLKNGYTVYSQVTLEVMDRICQAHGFDVHRPWSELTEAQREVVLYGTEALEVPFGKHGLASRMKWEGITARPREEGYYRGLVPVIEETLQRNRNPSVLRFVRSVPCSECAGSRLAGPGRQARVGDQTLPALLSLPVDALVRTLDQLPASPVWEALRPPLETRLRRLQRLGLGHLSLDRQSTTLSGGEGQRVRLVAQLSASLGGLLFALDEPTLGLHPEAQPGMAAVLEELRALGNTLLVVEHDPDMVRHAEHLVVLGPGAGPDGGRVLFAGPLADSPDPAHPLGELPAEPGTPRTPQGALHLRGATLHNLDGVDLRVPLGCFSVVTGPSGAGKSSLVFGTLLPALEGRAGGPLRSLEGVPAELTVRAVDASPIGRTPRSTPATWSGLFDSVRKRFSATPEARSRGWSASRFSFNTRAGRCPRCEGLGTRRVGLHLLEDLELPCPDCGGRRYADDTLEVRLRGASIADVLAMRMDQARAFFAEDPPLATLCTAFVDLGLGYLRLGQSSTTLSRGEAQRVKLATLVGKVGTEPTPAGTPGRRTRVASPTLLLMDEPDRGLHPSDVARLLGAIDRLVDAGHTVLAISHHRRLWAAADHRVALRDGRLAAPRALSPSPPPGPRPAAPSPAEIRLSGVRTHNLADLEVVLPHRALTVIAGPSGSGKSSLAFATLAGEAWARFAESLPFQVRRFVRRLPRPALDSAEGLTPTLAMQQHQTRAGRRSTVATQSELGPLLRLLWSRAGTVDGVPCALSAAHFSPDRALGACPGCEGLGTKPRCDPTALVRHPDRALLDGAMEGTRPGRYFGEPDGQYMATLAAALRAALGEEVDLHAPWQALPAAAREIALYGTGDQVYSVAWRFQRGQRSGTHHFEGPWEGLCALVEAEARTRAGRKRGAQWAAPLVDRPCPDCRGQRLGAQSRAVVIDGLALPTLLALPLAEVADRLRGLTLDPAQQAILDRLWPELAARLSDLAGLGLGHLCLDRQSRSLSDGELQRTRLASVLRAGLTGLTIVLDEPSAGLHGQDVDALVQRLRDLRDQGNTVVVVDHRPDLIRAADHLLELGPGAGDAGGRIVAQGAVADVLAGDSPTARALRHRPAAAPATVAPRSLRIHQATLHNLRDLDVDLPPAGFVAISGPSGSGKSSLVFGVLAASAEAGHPVGCARIDGLDRFTTVISARSDRPRAPVDTLDLLAPLQRLFHEAARDAGRQDLPRRAFSFRSPAGRCPACKGTGRERVSMDFLADLDLPCPRCAGRRYRPEVLAVQWQDLSIDRFLDRPTAALVELLPPGRLRGGVEAMVRLGLGHLSLGRRGPTLSGGEAQRLRLAGSLLRDTGPVLHLLDEPAKGLHEADLSGLVDIFRELGARGDLVVATAHRRTLVQAADWELELGPGGGPAGGQRISEGPPR